MSKYSRNSSAELRSARSSSKLSVSQGMVFSGFKQFVGRGVLTIDHRQQRQHAERIAGVDLGNLLQARTRLVQSS